MHHFTSLRDTFYLFSSPEENSVIIKIVLGKALIPCPRTIANIPESAIKPTQIAPEIFENPTLPRLIALT
jgi:hypothetical protein